MSNKIFILKNNKNIENKRESDIKNITLYIYIYIYTHTYILLIDFFSTKKKSIFWKVTLNSFLFEVVFKKN